MQDLFAGCLRRNQFLVQNRSWQVGNLPAPGSQAQAEQAVESFAPGADS